MFLSKLGYTIPLLAALSEGVTLPHLSLPIIHPTIPILSLSPVATPTPTPSPSTLPSISPPSTAPPLPVPTVGPALKNTTFLSHGLGGTTVPLTVTETFEPMIWSTIAVSNLTIPVTAPGSGPAPAIETSAPVSSNSTIIPRGEIKKRNLPVSVDWRNRGGLNWLTSIQDQGGCESCWVFSATALIETMVRIQHGMWSKRSEADLHDSMGVSCGQTGGPDGALTWAAGTGGGVADKQCDEYDGDDKPWFPCGDRSGRTLRIPTYTSLNTIADQKQWLADVGPISACFNVYWDFFDWDWAKAPYKYDGTSGLDGGHCILLVGYDDNEGAWIMRNSWGPYFGVNGYGNLTYGTAQIDNWTKFGITNVNPDPWTRKRHHNGCLYQGGNGAIHKNFEMVRANPAGGLTQIWRDGSSWVWSAGSNLVALDSTGKPQVGQYVNGQPSMLGSSFNRDFEVLFWGDSGTLNHWYYSETHGGWYFTGQLNYPAPAVQNSFSGYPGFVETDDSNFAIVVRNSDGSLWESQRNTKSGAFTFEAVISGPATVLQSGPALVQSNVGLDQNDPLSAGNLYVVAVLASGKMQMFYRPSSNNPFSPISMNKTWIPTEVFGSGIGDTAPVMVQDYWRSQDENTPGGFQLLIAVDGVVQHWQRVNTDIATNPPVAGGPGKWQHVLTFGTGIRNVWSLVHGSFNQALEAVVEDMAGNLWHWEYTNAGWNVVAEIPS